MEDSTALELAKINQARVFKIWFGLGGDVALTSRATGLRPRIIEALAHDYGWAQIAGGKLGLEDKKAEREINRAVSYAEGDRLTQLFAKALDILEEDETMLRSALVTTTEDGRRVVTAKPLVELAKAFETAHSIKYRALGDKVAEQADGVGINSDRIKSLSLSVVNLMNNAAAHAKVPVKVVAESLDLES